MTAVGRRLIEPLIERQIMDRLAAMESEEGATIVYACEAGSRAWGFESPDSDYDVRFVYVRPRDWYLSFDVERRRDVIERPIVDDIDCSGWDVRKALHLFARTNGALLEWLNSPVRYVERGSFAVSLRQLAEAHFNATALCYHYSHMARRNFRERLIGSQVRLKKYLYVLRPLLAIRHIERGLGVPPVRFESLVEAVAPDAARPGIAKLLDVKRAAPERGTGEPIPELNRFIDAELDRHRDAFSGLGRPNLLESADLGLRLNAIFRETINEAEDFR
ncbi:MAG: nucleotidyltransferase domain-containing protein [Gammaproteobacteria bacterium]|nr:nucleotidyltransferase domain-containing protein [Gammaproteobacteria bacterium]